MNGKRAKEIRREFYGDRATRPEARRYFRQNDGSIVADPWRNVYQGLKRTY